MVQWLRVNLPMQGTQVQSLVWEDFTCSVAIVTEVSVPWSLFSATGKSPE